jgi:hypothetical protein
MRARSDRKRALILTLYAVWYAASPESAVPAMDRQGRVTGRFPGEEEISGLHP